MTLATILRKVDPTKAVDLAAPAFVAESQRNRKLALLEDQVTVEVTRLNARRLFLTRKASRSGVASNARRKATVEAQACQAFALLLGKAVRGERLPKLPPYAATTPALERARQLFNELQAA